MKEKPKVSAFELLLKKPTVYTKKKKWFIFK